MADGAVLEIEFTPGVWTDVSQWLQQGVELEFGTSSWDDDGQAGTLKKAVLYNDDGRFTPDNPLSPHWPNVVEGVRCRWSIVYLGVTYRRGWFRIKDWSLATTKVARDSTVTITGTDQLGALSRRAMDSDIIERYRWVTRSNGGTWVDAWPLITSGRPRRPHNVGTGPDPVSALAVDPPQGRGACSYADPSPLFLEGSITTQVNKNLGPVIVFPTQRSDAAPMRSCAFWFRVPGQNFGAGTTGDNAVLASGWDEAGARVWRWVVVYDPYPTQRLSFDWWNGAAWVRISVDDAINDNAWHSVYMQQTNPGATSGVFYDSFTGEPLAAVSGVDLSRTKTIVMGGFMNPNAPGGQTSESVAMGIAGVMASDQIANAIEQYARGGTHFLANVRFLGDYRNWAGFTGNYLGPAARTVVMTSSIGKSVTDQVQELARTVAGTVWCDPRTNRVELIAGEGRRSPVVSLTLTVGEDDDITPGQVWRRGALENPTRQTVTSPAGDGTYIDAGAETYERRDGSSVSAATISPADSRALAAWYVRRGRRLRLSQVSIDVTTAVQDMWLWVLQTLRPGVRIRVQGLDPTQIGYTSRDVYVLGWSETWDELEDGVQSCRITLDTVSADTPAEAIYDDPAYGRYDFDGVQATIGAISAAATSATITVASGPVLTTDPADYPLHLHINGETVRVDAPPASSTSPQTVTIARAQHGSIARAHAAGTAIQVYPMSSYGA